MKAIYLACALSLSAFAITPASAAPALHAEGLASAALPLILVQYPGHDYDYRPHRDRHRRYVPGHRYHAAPHGWHRYHRRPRDWRTRGCILVGPFWFCP